MIAWTTAFPERGLPTLCLPLIAVARSPMPSAACVLVLAVPRMRCRDQQALGLTARFIACPGRGRRRRAPRRARPTSADLALIESLAGEPIQRNRTPACRSDRTARCTSGRHSISRMSVTSRTSGHRATGVRWRACGVRFSGAAPTDARPSPSRSRTLRGTRRECDAITPAAANDRSLGRSTSRSCRSKSIRRRSSPTRSATPSLLRRAPR